MVYFLLCVLVLGRDSTLQGRVTADSHARVQALNKRDKVWFGWKVLPLGLPI